jgi:hypothetical protein
VENFRVNFFPDDDSEPQENFLSSVQVVTAAQVVQALEARFGRRTGILRLLLAVSGLPPLQWLIYTHRSP